MVTKVKCRNPKCPAYNVEFSFAVRQYIHGLGPNCAQCGNKMGVAESINTSAKGVRKFGTSKNVKR